MFYDEEEEVRVIESLDGSELWTEKSVGYVGGDTEGTVYLIHRDPDRQETAEAFSPTEAMRLAIELARAAGVDTEPHIWEAYVNIVDSQGRSKFFKQLSLHASKAGAEAAVEDAKRAAPDETSDPNFIVATRRLEIGA